MMSGPRRTVDTEQVLDAGFFTVVREAVELPDGRTKDYFTARHPGAVAIVPVDEDGRVLMVRQFRQAADDTLLEIPAGKLEPDEDPWDCAQRELEEETGYRCERLELLTRFYASPGMTDEQIYVFLGTGLELVTAIPSHDGGEPIWSEWLDSGEVLPAIDDGRIVDGKSIVGLTLYKVKEHEQVHDLD